jgi:hypothetical protein
VDPVRTSTGLASPQRGDPTVRLALSLGLRDATPLRSAPPGRLVLKRSQSTRFSSPQEPGHVEVPSVREGYRVHDAEVDPDSRILTRFDGRHRLMDAETDVPAERILQQSGAGNAALGGFSGDW